MAEARRSDTKTSLRASLCCSALVLAFASSEAVEATAVPSQPLVVSQAYQLTPEAMATALKSPSVVLPPEADGPPNPDCATTDCTCPTCPASASRTPAAVPRFSAALYRPLDPGIAVSDHYVMVADDKNIAVYDKTGLLLPPKSNPFPNPFTADSLFRPMYADIDQHLTYPSDIPASYDRTVGVFADARVLYDPYRKRFFIAGVVQNNLAKEIYGACYQGQTEGCTQEQYDALVANKDLLLTWRQKFVVAVSLTEDPRDGFYLHWWDAVIADGKCLQWQSCGNPSTFTVATASVDYPMIGISDRFFLATVADAFVQTDPTKAPDILNNFPQWLYCYRRWYLPDANPDSCKIQLYSDVMMVPADQLANPNFSTTTPPARSFFLEATAANGITWPYRESVRPAMHHSKTNNDAIFANAYSESGKCYAAAHIVTLSLTLAPIVRTVKVPVSTCTVDDYTRHGGSAAYRDGKLYMAWEQRDPSHVQIHVVRFNPFAAHPRQGTAFFQQVLPTKNSAEGGTDAYDEFPAIEVNHRGDVAVVYARYASNLPQEVRFSVRKKSDAKFRSDRLLWAGESAGQEVTDTAGIAVDPTDDTSIWMAHFYSDSQNGFRIAIGRVLGPP